MTKLEFENQDIHNLLGTSYKNAINNLININTVMCDDTYNRTGLITTFPSLMIRAGENYETPWTRDASINSWNAASLLQSIVARNTLWAVCEREDSGKLFIQRDDQWWDKVIWVTAAWNHYKITGDENFLINAYKVSIESLNEMKVDYYNKKYGLFQGPSFFNDGIAGYPQPPFELNNPSSFVLDHSGTDKMMALSTNCIYFNAYMSAAQMALQLGGPVSKIEELKDMAISIKNNINKYLWIPEKENYGYFIHGSGELIDKLDISEEGAGLAFAIIFGVADVDKRRKILENTHVQPKGITDVWPHFDRYDDDHPGRHNGIVWPMVSGMWAHATAMGGRIDLFKSELTNMALLANSTEGNFYEIYHSVTGAIDGGWQCDYQWDSCLNQTWSATAYLRAIYYGLFGMNFESDGIKFTPTLPTGWGSVKLEGIKYRDMTLEITINGKGNHVKSFILDGNLLETPCIETDLKGIHNIIINMEES